MPSTYLSSLCVLVRRFAADARGTTAIIFAMLAVSVLGLGLAGLDFSRAQGTKSKIQSALDAAATAGAQMLGAPHSEIENAVRGYLRTNLPADRRELGFVLTFATDDTSLTIKTDTSVPTSILGIVGLTELAVHVEATADKPALIKVQPPAHRGITPDLPSEIQSQFPGLARSIPPEQLREAEAAARQILRELERAGSTAEIANVLRGLSQRQ